MTDLVIVVFSCADPQSMMNVSRKWIPEVRKHCQNIPIILLATKIDARKNGEAKKRLLLNHSMFPVSQEQGKLMARKTGCITYVETCAREGKGIDSIYEVVFTGIQVFHQKKTCSIQ